MKRIQFWSLTLLCIALGFGTVAKGSELSKRNKCDLLVQLLPEDLQDLPLDACEYETAQNSQVTVWVQLTVPANRLIDVEHILVSDYSMEPLRFVCCGFETKSVDFYLPKDHPLRDGTPSGAFRRVILSFFATAYLDGDPSKLTRELGHSDGTLRLELVDI